MPWFVVDDKLHSHKKAVRAGAHALGLWALAGSWSADQLTDGFVPDYMAARMAPDYAELAAALVAADLWTASEKDGEQGWQFHDWEDFQPTRQAVVEKRAAAKERMHRLRESRRNGSREQAANEHGTSREVRSAPALPNPAQPTLKKEVADATSSRGKRGTRIPDDFTITPELKAWAVDKGYDRLDLDAITEEFFDYWRGVAGAKGVKLDWESTWRNWIRRKGDEMRPRTTRSDSGLSLEARRARGEWYL